MIICNGPSVKELVEYGFNSIPKHIDTVACSLAYRHFKEVNWWPTYYCLTDPKVLLHHKEAFQEMILDPSNGIKKFFLSTKLPQLDIDIQFQDPFKRVVDTEWQVTGQAAFKVALMHRYEYLYIIGCDNRYYWDHSLVKPLNGTRKEDNRAIVIEDVLENPNYGIPNYLRKGDITSWLFNHPDKSITSSSNNKVWDELVAEAELKKIKIIDFSNSNLPVKTKEKSVIKLLAH